MRSHMDIRYPISMQVVSIAQTAFFYSVCTGPTEGVKKVWAIPGDSVSLMGSFSLHLMKPVIQYPVIWLKIRDVWSFN